MYLFNLQAKPLKKVEEHPQVIGAYVSAYINFIDVDGAVELAKHYIESEGWEVISIDDDFYQLTSKSDLEKEHQDIYDETKEYGYTLIFNAYEEGSEEEE